MTRLRFGAPKHGARERSSVEGGEGNAEKGTVDRWRIVNSADAPTMGIAIENACFRIVATDVGLLPRRSALLVAIRKRLDLEVTYDQPGNVRLLYILEHAEMGMMGEIKVTLHPNAPPVSAAMKVARTRRVTAPVTTRSLLADEPIGR